MMRMYIEVSLLYMQNFCLDNQIKMKKKYPNNIFYVKFLVIETKILLSGFFR
jgi:hypothetical protein